MRDRMYTILDTYFDDNDCVMEEEDRIALSIIYDLVSDTDEFAIDTLEEQVRQARAE